MWKYIRKYLPYAVLAAVCMVCEVLMDLIQPGIMSRIVDEGRIVERGSHEELLRKRGKYYELYMTQYAGFET